MKNLKNWRNMMNMNVQYEQSQIVWLELVWLAIGKMMMHQLT